MEWRVNSHIEKQLSLLENDYLVAYFDTATGILNFLEQLKQHSFNILYAIHTDIPFGSRPIKIERPNETNAELLTRYCQKRG